MDESLRDRRSKSNVLIFLGAVMSSLSSSTALLDQFLGADQALIVVDADWSIVEMAQNISSFADSPIQLLQDVREGFPELIGIDSLMESGQRQFELKGICRSTTQGLRYFNLKIFSDFYDRWIIVVSDATETFCLEQSLAQQANQANLLLAQLSASKAYIDQVIASLPDALIVTTAKGIIKTINPATQQLLEYTESELLNQSIEVVLQSLSDADSIKPESVREFETTCSTKMGRSIPIAFSCAKVKSAIEDFDGFIYSLRDITERQQAERAKRTFFAMISHEIRTPMNAVMGMTNLLLETELSDQQRDLLETIQSSSDSLLTIINDVLDYSKIESGNLELEQQPFAIRNCVQDAIDLLNCKAIEKNLTLRLNAPKLLPSVIGDRVRLRQILINLIGNAIKFTNNGEVVVSVTSREQSPEVVELEFAVKDSGIGMSSAQSDRLFQTFHQADASITRRFGGTGLGLAISKQLCEIMGGRIWVESEAGKGSTFYFTIVVPMSEQIDQTVRSQINIDSSFALQHPLKILVAEDHVVNQKVIHLTLQRLGYQIDLVSNGLEAIDALRHQAYDVVFMDLQMPEMDGLAATEQICRERKHRPRIVAMTASATLEDRSQCSAAGMDDYLTKPLQISELIRVLSTAQPVQPGMIALENVLHLAGGSVEFVAEIIDCFVEDTPKLLHSMQFALAQQDFKSLKRFAHTLQSSSATFGAANLEKLSAELETMVIESELSQASIQIDKIETEYQQVKLALQAEQQKYQNVI